MAKARPKKPTRTRAVTASGFRRMALAMPGAVEREHMGQPDFRVGGKIFATLPERDTLEEWGMVRLTAAQQRAFIQDEAFERAQGAWGRWGCTYVRLAAVDRETLRRAVELAWRNRAPKGTVEEREM